MTPALPAEAPSGVTCLCSMKAIRIRSIILKLTLATLLSAFALELLVRFLGLAPPLNVQYSYFVPDEHVPFRPKPSSELTGGSLSSEFSFTHKHNSLGFRDVERTTKKPDGTRRILVIGDSFTYGVGADADHTFPALLERHLNKLHPESLTEVINAGVPRYFPAAEVQMLRHYGLPLQPDIVIVAFTANDPAETELGLDAVTPDTQHGFLKSREAEMLGDWGIYAYRYSHIFRVLWNSYVTSQLWEGPHLHPGASASELLASVWPKVDAAYTEMLSLATQAGAQLIVLYIPSRDFRSQFNAEVANHLETWAAKHSVPFVDVRSALSSVDASAPLYWKHDQHCTAAGYEVIASELTKVLEP